jgi:hypothetical protein
LLNNIREIATSSSGFNVSVSEGQDYSKVNAKILMNTFDTQWVISPYNKDWL